MDKQDFSEKAQKVMARAGQPDCETWPVGTELFEMSSGGGWGNWSFESRWVNTHGTMDEPLGTVLSWNSDDRIWTVATYDVPCPTRA